MLSVIVPCMNEEKAIPLFYQAVSEIEEELSEELEYVFVDDGSTDLTLDRIKELAQEDGRVHYASFSRNFGKEAALLAGLEMARGDFVVTMDVDLQDPPALLPEMLDTVKGGKGYDCVATRRTTRQGEPVIRSFLARCFYKIINKMSETEIVDGARDYRLMTRQMADAVIRDREYNRFSKGLYAWVGFRTKWIDYENIERSAGETKWSIGKLFLYAVDGILAYSTLPLSLSSVIGILMCGASFLALCFIVLRAMLFGDPVAGWPSMVSVVIFIGGIVLFSLGIIGLYLGKIYLETKKRPIYIIREQG